MGQILRHSLGCLRRRHTAPDMLKFTDISLKDSGCSAQDASGEDLSLHWCAKYGSICSHQYENVVAQLAPVSFTKLHTTTLYVGGFRLLWIDLAMTSAERCSYVGRSKCHNLRMETDPLNL